VSTLPSGAALPSDAECSSRVAKTPEVRPGNERYNETRGRQKNIAEKWLDRVTGDFTGTTDEILQWGACKWGLSDNMVRAMAVNESKWHQNTEADSEPHTNGNCAPGDPRNPCPTSFGILQIKWYFHPSKSAEGSSYPMSRTMTAFNVDYTLSEMRGCYDGLSFVGEKAKGDLFGCMGVWYAGEWRNSDAEAYIAL
jgi:autotransporter family porin